MNKKTSVAVSLGVAALLTSAINVEATFADCTVFFQVPQNTWNANPGMSCSWTNWLTGAHGSITNSTPVSLPNGSEVEGKDLGCRIVPYNWANYQLISCGTTNAASVIAMPAWTVTAWYSLNIFCACPNSGSHASMNQEGNGVSCQP